MQVAVEMVNLPLAEVQVSLERLNTGGGGGGSAWGTTGVGGESDGGDGGKGVVILSVPTANYSSSTSGSPTVTTSGSNTIMKFTGSGSYTT